METGQDTLSPRPRRRYHAESRGGCPNPSRFSPCIPTIPNPERRRGKTASEPIAPPLLLGGREQGAVNAYPEP